MHIILSMGGAKAINIALIIVGIISYVNEYRRSNSKAFQSRFHPLGDGIFEYCRVPLYHLAELVIVEVQAILEPVQFGLDVVLDAPLEHARLLQHQFSKRLVVQQQSSLQVVDRAKPVHLLVRVEVDPGGGSAAPAVPASASATAGMVVVVVVPASSATPAPIVAVVVISSASSSSVVPPASIVVVPPSAAAVVVVP